MKRLNFIKVLVIALFTVHCATMVAQDEVPALFSYPQAPDTCTSLESRSNYVMMHFWDGFDLTKPITNDASLVKTFRDYVDVFRFGHRTVVLSSVRDFMFKLRSNAENLSKVGRIAEAVLYGPYADYWSDEVYVEFARSLAAATVLKKEEREYYQQQIGRMTACQEGMTLELDYVDAVTDQKMKLMDVPVSNVLLLVFMDSSVDSSIGRTRLATDVNLARLMDEGQVRVMCIYDGKPSSDWAASLPDGWVKGYSSNLTSKLDVRMMPSCYMLDAEHKIMNKNITIAEFKQAIE
ncbi:MAG: DUF5106 domain-containing protein [Muribaculaceae bacterium]|nr:DUF5106 domain-containing protein [Muribaculaceae bacterium]